MQVVQRCVREDTGHIQAAFTVCTCSNNNKLNVVHVFRLILLHLLSSPMPDLTALTAWYTWDAHPED